NRIESELQALPRRGPLNAATNSPPRVSIPSVSVEADTANVYIGQSASSLGTSLLRTRYSEGWVQFVSPLASVLPRRLSKSGHSMILARFAVGLHSCMMHLTSASCNAAAT